MDLLTEIQAKILTLLNIEEIEVFLEGLDSVLPGLGQSVIPYSQVVEPKCHSLKTVKLEDIYNGQNQAYINIINIKNLSALNVRDMFRRVANSFNYFVISEVKDYQTLSTLSSPHQKSKISQLLSSLSSRHTCFLNNSRNVGIKDVNLDSSKLSIGKLRFLRLYNCNIYSQYPALSFHVYQYPGWARKEAIHENGAEVRQVGQSAMIYDGTNPKHISIHSLYAKYSSNWQHIFLDA
jgi:hypothetical protein